MSFRMRAGVRAEDGGGAIAPSAAPAGSALTAWRRGDRGQITLLAFAHAVQHFYTAALAFSYPYVVQDFRISYATLGAVLGRV